MARTKNIARKSTGGVNPKIEKEKIEKKEEEKKDPKYIIIKQGYEINFQKNPKGIVCTLLRNSNKKSYCIVHPGNIFMLDEKSNWKMLDTTKLKPERAFINLIDKASYELSRILTLFPIDKVILSFRNDEYVFLETLIYDLFTDIEVLNRWIPGKGEAWYIDLDHEIITAVYHDGTREEMVPTKGVSFEIYEKLPPVLPPITQTVLPPITQTVLPPILNPVLPPISKAVLPPISNPVLPPISKPVLPPISKPVLPPLTQTVLPPLTQTVLPPLTQIVLPPLAPTLIPDTKVLSNDQTSSPIKKSFSSPSGISIPVNLSPVLSKVPIPMIPLISSPRTERKNQINDDLTISEIMFGKPQTPIPDDPDSIDNLIKKFVSEENKLVSEEKPFSQMDTQEL